MAREFLWLVVESAYGTPKTSPTAGTDSIYIRLDDGNAFTMRPKPKQWNIMHGGGLAIKTITGSDVTMVAGSLKLKLCYSQALFLLNWATTRINSAQTSPWTTTEPAGDLASVSVYHAIQRSDGTYKRRQYPGCKVAKVGLKTTADSQLVELDLDLVAQKPVGNTYDSSSDPTSGAFPAPAESAYPTDVVNFTHASGGLVIASNTRTLFGELSFDMTNAIDARTYESRWVQIMRVLGRDSTMTVKNLYVPSPDDRSAYEIQSAQTATLALTNGTHTITLNFEGNNVLNSVDDDLSLDKVYEQTFVLQNQWDPTALSGVGQDFLFTFA